MILSYDTIVSTEITSAFHFCFVHTKKLARTITVMIITIKTQNRYVQGVPKIMYILYEYNHYCNTYLILWLLLQFEYKNSYHIFDSELYRLWLRFVVVALASLNNLPSRLSVPAHRIFISFWILLLCCWLTIWNSNIDIVGQRNSEYNGQFVAKISIPMSCHNLYT